MLVCKKARYTIAMSCNDVCVGRRLLAKASWYKSYHLRVRAADLADQCAHGRRVEEQAHRLHGYAQHSTRFTCLIVREQHAECATLGICARCLTLRAPAEKVWADRQVCSSLTNMSLLVDTFVEAQLRRATTGTDYGQEAVVRRAISTRCLLGHRPGRERW